MKWYKLLLPRKPKGKREWRYKICVSLILALIAIMYIQATANNTSDGALGTYDPRTDEIWIKPDLDNELRDIVTTHELAHQAFYYAIPFWMYMKFALFYLAIYLVSLGLMIQRYNLYYVSLLLMGVSSASEIHAYSWALLMHGFEMNCALGLTVLVGVPITIGVLIRFVFPSMVSLIATKATEPTRIVISRFGKRAFRRVKLLRIAEMIIFVGMGIGLGLIMSGVRNLLTLIPLCWGLTISLLLLARETKKMEIGTCRIRRIRKARGRPRKIEKK